MKQNKTKNQKVIPPAPKKAPGISWASVLTTVKEIKPFKHNIPEPIFQEMVETLMANNCWADMAEFEEEYNVNLMDYMDFMV
jgi:hypothetical protein